MTTKWVQSLTDWFAEHQREMPWRSQPEPYYVWVSEMMLQQTQVSTVIPYFKRFITQFPTVESLASSDLQSVLKAWEGLGYYSRARYLHKAANKIVTDLSGQFPEDYDSLQKLPGIGPYCAAAITSIAFERPVPVVDGNVLRVFTRFWGIFDDIKQPKVRQVIFDKLAPYIREATPSQFNQALMECGALICTPQKPSCNSCPLHKHCFAFKHNQTQELPVKSKASKVPHYDIVIGLIKDKEKLLIARRKENQMLGGLWEFPGGKIKKNESETEALKREIKEEVGLSVDVEDKIGSIKHAYSHFKITLHAYWCSYESGTATAISSDEIQWIQKEQLKDFPFPTANKKIFKLIDINS